MSIILGKKCMKDLGLKLFIRNLSKKPKTGIILLNMGGPQKKEQVHDYLLRIMTDRDMIQLPFAQKFV